jgi:hypothetical protein
MRQLIFIIPVLCCLVTSSQAAPASTLQCIQEAPKHPVKKFTIPISFKVAKLVRRFDGFCAIAQPDDKNFAKLECFDDEGASVFVPSYFNATDMIDFKIQTFEMFEGVSSSKESLQTIKVKVTLFCYLNHYGQAQCSSRYSRGLVRQPEDEVYSSQNFTNMIPLRFIFTQFSESEIYTDIVPKIGDFYYGHRRFQPYFGNPVPNSVNLHADLQLEVGDFDAHDLLNFRQITARDFRPVVRSENKQLMLLESGRLFRANESVEGMFLGIDPYGDFRDESFAINNLGQLVFIQRYQQLLSGHLVGIAMPEVTVGMGKIRSLASGQHWLFVMNYKKEIWRLSPPSYGLLNDASRWSAPQLYFENAHQFIVQKNTVCAWVGN